MTRKQASIATLNEPANGHLPASGPMPSAIMVSEAPLSDTLPAAEPKKPPSAPGVFILAPGERPGLARIRRLRIGNRVAFLGATWLKGTVKMFIGAEKVHVELDTFQGAPELPHTRGANGTGVAFRDVIVARRAIDFDQDENP